MSNRHYPGSMPTNSTTITRSYDRPVTNRERLGGVPRDHYEASRLPRHGLGKVDRRPGAEGGPVDVYRDVPLYDENGEPRMENVTVTLTEEAYEPKRRGLGCGFVGAVAGALGAATLLAAGPVGIAVAAGVGALAGKALGNSTAEGDEVQEVWEDRTIVHPHMEGHTEYTIPVPDFERRCSVDENGERDCSVEITGIRGYYHHHRPDIREDEVGSYTEPTLQHTRKMGPGAAAALAAGAGLALGVAVAVAEHALKD